MRDADNRIIREEQIKINTMQTIKFILFMILCIPVLACFNGESPDGSFNPIINLFGILYSYIVFCVLKIQNKLL